MTATRDSGTLVRALLPHHWRLSTRLTAAMVVVLGLLLGFSFITYGQLQRQRRGDELGNATAITETVAAQIDGFLRDIESTTLAIAQGLAIQDVPLTQRTVGTPLRNVQESYGILRALFCVLLAAATSADTEQAVRLVQQIHLQQLPPVLMIAGSENAAAGGELARLDPYVAGRIQWPEQADTLRGRSRARDSASARSAFPG